MKAFHRAEEFEGLTSQSEENEVLHELLGHVPGGLFRYRADGDDTLDFVNNGLIEIFGCKDFDEFCSLTENTFSGLVLPEDRERVMEALSKKTAKDESLTYRIRRADGEVRWLDDRGKLVVDSDGVRWFYVNVMDVTERMESRRQLERANERLNILTALSNDVLFDIQCATGDADVYGDFEGRFGRECEQADFVVHRRCKNECNLNITTHDLSPLMEQITEDSLVDFETSTVDANGEPIWYRYQSVVLYDDEGMPVRHVGRLLDTHDMAVRESEFRRRAERDGLTGLLNRAAALNRIETLLNTENRPCTLIAIDVDDFKGVNDTYGHPEGDRVLTELASFLDAAMRKEDVVARMGGDEFVIFAPGLGPSFALTRVLNHLTRGPFQSSRSTDVGEPEILHEAAPTISVGAACCMNPPMTFDELYAAADKALYSVKEGGKASSELVIIN